MRLTLRAQFLASLAAQGGSQLVTIASQILIVPLMLTLWGSERYGAWIIISAIPTYLSMADLGFAQVSANDMTMRVARGDFDGAVVVNQTAWLMNGAMSLAAILFMIGFVLIVPIGTTFHIENAADHIGGATVFLALITVNSILFGVVGGAMRAQGLVSFMVAANALTRLITFLCLVAGAFAGFGFVGCSAAMYLGSTANIVLVALVFYRKYPSFRPGIRRADTTLLRKMIAPSLSYMSYTLSNGINIQGVNLLTGAILGPESVVIVSSIRTLTRLGRMVVSVANFAMEPIFAQLYGRGDQANNRSAYRRLVTSVIFGTFAFAVGMWLFGEPILAAWTHGAVVDQTLLFRTMLIAVVVEMIWFTLQTPYLSTNRHSLLALYYLGFSIISFLLLIPSFSWFGLPAVGWISIAAQVAVLLVTLIIGLKVSPHAVAVNP